MRSWGWWRRGGGVGDCYYLGKEEVAVLRSLVLGCGPARPASAEGWMVDSGSRQPSRSIVAAAAGTWGTSLQHGRVNKRLPPSAHSVVPCVGSLSTKTWASSRRRLGSPDNEDGEKREEKEALFSARGGDDESEPEIDGSWTEEWEEEDNAEPEIGDGGDGGGIVLGNVGWGERALSIANEILRLHLDEDTKMFAFKISPKGYIYVRLDKLANQYGCPTMEEIEKFSMLYNKRLEESGESGEIPKDLALEVSSPGAERLLKVPEDLDRFKGMPMVVHYLEEDPESRQSGLKEGVFLLEAVDAEARQCVWKLADVRENRDPLSKGRPLSRKRKDWRLRVPFEMLKRVMLYVPLS